MQADLHPLAWLSWLAAAAGSALLVRHPFYLLVILLAELFVYATLWQRQQRDTGYDGATSTLSLRAMLRLLPFIIVLSMAFNALAVHVGAHVLFALPRSWPLVGGPITLEALLYGLLSGLGLATLIAAFFTLQLAVSAHTLLRLTPGFAHHAGVAVTIAVSFVPQTFVAYREMREAQRLRGYRVRGLRDLQPLFVSLLAHGLERAIQLAESMDARGFGGALKPLTERDRRLVGLSSLGGLILLLLGLIWHSFAMAPAFAGWIALTLGTGGLVFSLHRQGQRVQRSRYRRWLWRPRDRILIGLSAAVLLLTIAARLAAPLALFYYPYPPYPLLPTFQPWWGALYALLLAPALLLPKISDPLPGV